MTELHPAINSRLLNIQEHIGRLVEKPIARMGVPLEGKETLLRTNETNLGNFLCDLLKLYFNTDIAFINSGSIRCDRQLGADGSSKRSNVDVFPLQLLRVRDVMGMYICVNPHNVHSHSHFPVLMKYVPHRGFALSRQI
jgi:2',3'-cyclic-nucleotide 2'-phosphodiesterase (5'-nucleotidase family)